LRCGCLQTLQGCGMFISPSVFMVKVVIDSPALNAAGEVSPLVRAKGSP
jgi:hypothetical protein